MYIESLELKNYKNISFMKLSFGKGVNIIYGENAQGKTNILEALWLFTGTKSFRYSKDADQIRFGEKKAQLDCKFFSHGFQQFASLEFGEKKTAVLNDVKLSNASGFSQFYPAVIFSPEHLSLVKGGPKERRQFIDNALCQIKPRFQEYLSKYKKNLLQRNALLRDYKNNASIESILEIFEENLASLGTQIIVQRKKYLEALIEQSREIYSGISSFKETIDFHYCCSFDDSDENKIKEHFLQALKKSRMEDMFTCSTSVGPHRDDLEILINGISARKFGSQGQQRSVVLALKLGEANVLKEKSGEQPIALLDDVMSELDEARQDYILHRIEGWQVFISCCDPNTILRLKKGETFKIEGGTLIK